MRQITRDLKIKHPLFSSFQNLSFAPLQTPMMRCWRRGAAPRAHCHSLRERPLLIPWSPLSKVSQATARHLVFSLLENGNRINIPLKFKRRISCSPKAKCLSLLLVPREHLLEQDYTTLFKKRHADY